jgi:Mannosyl-glycoprotein endo-beta-N-acetylglucosaminidase/Penicillin-insensitive murein endopeptidase
MTLVDDLAQKSAQADLPAVFSAVGLNGIKPADYEELRTVTLAQWLLESGRATSLLSTKANNFSGLKWRSEMTGFATQIDIQVPSEEISMEFCQFTDLDAFIKGYWKFLTRPVYAGLAECTDSPDRFIGFIQRQGFSADPTYISQVLSLLVEAEERLAKARGQTTTKPTFTFQITSFPKAVGVGENFTVAGTAPPTAQGRDLSAIWDNKFTVTGTTVGSDGRWQLQLIVRQAGDRQLKVTLDGQSKEVTIKAQALPDGDGHTESPQPPGAVKILLDGSVGLGGINRAVDVIAVKKRLAQLGFNWIGDPNSASLNTGFFNVIRLFQSIVLGQSNVDGDGRIDVGGFTHRWLQAKNAAVWKTMPDSDPLINFVNYEKAQTNDDHDYGTNWLSDTILQIATEYKKTSGGSAPLTINDVSRPQGGDTPDHAGHETGLMCDVNLPRSDGKAGDITWRDDLFDRSAARKIIQAMRKQPLVRAVYFNDPTLLDEGLCDFSGGHDNHIHFEINPPVRQ